MDFREIVPPPWSPIERIWLARGDGAGSETILPDGRYELIFHLGDPVYQDDAAQPGSMLSGETRRATVVKPSGRIDCVGVTLRDGCAAAVLGAPLREVRDAMFDLRSMGSRLDLREALGNAASDAERAGIVIRALGTAERDPVARMTAGAIRRSGGRASMTRIAAQCGVTVRTLSRAFAGAMGITPKTLARVTRLGNAARMLRAGSSASDAALGAGFFDQAHMVNEFRSMAAVSPARWLSGPGVLAVQFLQDDPAPRG